MFTPCAASTHPDAAATSSTESGFVAPDPNNPFGLFAELTPPSPLLTQSRGSVSSTDDDASEWSEAELVQLHWRLLEALRHLPEPDTPLEEKIDALNWVFTDPSKESHPFSFVSCLRVVGGSALSPTAFFGRLDADEIRDWIRARVARWMRSTLDRYPAWVRQLVRDDPAQCVRQLERNPQWLNEQVRQRTARPDLFA